MKNNYHNFSLSRILLLLAMILLFLPEEVLPGNNRHGINYSPPTITCPSDIVVNNDAGLCSAVVNYTPPANAAQTAGLPSGSAFPVGITTNSFTGTDNSTCSFTVTVNDNEPPIIVCPDDIFQSPATGVCQTVEFDIPEATDNCGTPTVVQIAGPSSGEVFASGETTITFQATDLAGNISTCSFTVYITGNGKKVLPEDGSASQMMTPQGGLRYQRSFYLITPDEMEESGIEAGTVINSIGFTTAVSQNIPATGNLKIYLQNTPDAVSRMDTSWTRVTTSSATYSLSGLNAGDYEWKVRAVCDGAPYSEVTTFSTSDPHECPQPYNLVTENIATTSATFSWEAAASEIFETFNLEYSVYPFEVWTPVSTTGTSYEVTGLTANSSYRWRIKSDCGSEESPLSAVSFNTPSNDACNEPASPVTVEITNNSVVVSWTAAAGADYYIIMYRKAGSPDWLSAMTNLTDFTLTSLEPGTTFEWKVSAHCPDGTGSAVAGDSFTTTGTAACYAPAGLKAGEITENSAVLSWLASQGATSYQISYRLKESISWSNASAPMALVSDGSFTIPDTIGAFTIPFNGTTPFEYEGEGLYVALEYSNPSGSLSSFNTVLCTKQNTFIRSEAGLDSLRFILAFNGRTDQTSTGLPLVMRSVDTRPETRFGSPALTDIAEVAEIYTMGQVALPYGSNVPVSAFVRNFTDENITLPVTLTIYDPATGTSKHTETVNQLIDASCGAFVSFADWTPSQTGTDSVVVAIPVQTGEDISDNNQVWQYQYINKVFQSYDDKTPAINGAGTGTDGGMVLSKLNMQGCGRVNSAKVFLNYSAEGHSLSAVVLDASGNILNTSPAFTPDSKYINNYHSFFFSNSPLITNSEYYIGILQSPSTEEYFPVGVQWEGSVIRDNAYFRANEDGTEIENAPFPGRLMISAEIIPGMAVPYIEGSDVLCNGGTNTLQAGSKTKRFASKVIAVSSEVESAGTGSMQALGSPDVFPAYAGGSGVWMNESTTSQREYIVLEFPGAAPVNYIEIFETFNPGAIDTVYVYNTTGEKTAVFTSTAVAQETSESKINLIEFDQTAYDVSKIRITMNTGVYSGYHAIDAVCIGQKALPGSFASYEWAPGGETTGSISVSNADTYSVTVTNSAGCEWTESMEVSVPDIIAPVITYEHPLSFCEGGSVKLTSSIEENITWSTDETTADITVSDPGTYTVTYNNGCEDITSGGVTITVFDLPVPSLTGGSMCQGASTEISAGSGYNTYTWSTGATGSSITVSYPGAYSVTVTDANECTGTGYTNAYFAPTPVPHITGNPWFCPNESSTLDAGDEFTGYLWSNGATTRQITVSAPGEITLTVTNEYGCTGNDAVTAGEYTPPQPYISGNLSLCSGLSTTLDAGGGYLAYQWSTGETSRTIVVNAGDTFEVEVTDQNGCKGTASATTDLEGAMPDIPGVITGPTDGVCQLTGIEYSIDPIPNTTHYVWTVPEGITITAGQGTPAITVNASSPVDGRISVAASNSCGQSATWNGRVLMITGTPAMPGAITGQQTSVCGLTNVQYSVGEVFGATSYYWTAPAGATITSGNGSTNITVTYSNTFTYGDLCVMAVNDCGTGVCRNMQITGQPASPSEIFGPVSVCNKEKNVVYSVTPQPNVTRYQWYVPLQATIVSGQGSSSIVVNFGNKSGNVSVQVSNNCGNSAVVNLAVTVGSCRSGDTYSYNFGVPDKPYNEDNPQWNYAWGNQIFVPEVLASAGDYSVNGEYTMSWTVGEPVIQTIADNKYMLTQGFHQQEYRILVETNPGTGFTIEVYPVPARDYINIRIITSYQPADLLIQLYDMMGNIVFTDNSEFRIYDHKVPINHLATGMFILKVTDVKENTQGSFKVIKMK